MALDDILKQVPIDDIAKQLGVSPDVAKTAVEQGGAVLLGGLAKNASTDEGSAAIQKALKKHEGTGGAASIKDIDQADGDKIVTIVMNIRDENFSDMNNANGFGYVVGYHSSGINDYHDRNTMTIDAFDWVHRSGAEPPNEPVAGAAAACTSRPAFPYRMESTFAHEYQHLIESYASPGESSWVNEGLSDYSMRKTDSGWKIYDIVVEGVSLVLTYRSEFDAVVKQEGVDGLIKRLGQKNTPAAAIGGTNK